MYLVYTTFVLIMFVYFVKWYVKSKSKLCECSKHMVGKVVIITGSNSGLGFETARNLADRGAKVILACRNEARGNEAANKIIAHTGNTDVHYRHLDLSSFRSVNEFAQNILKTEKNLHVLINNAGASGLGYKVTEDGLFEVMQVNHFGPFLLTNLLLPLLKASAPSRIINVSSMLHPYGKIDLENLNMEKRNRITYELDVYSNSKLCNVLMTNELSCRLKDTNVTVNTADPGTAETNITKKFENPLHEYILWIAVKWFFLTAWEGAQTSIYLAVSPEVEGVSGFYFKDCKKAVCSQLGRDVQLARKLWEKSEQFVKITQ